MARPPYSLETSINKIYLPFLVIFFIFLCQKRQGYFPVILVDKVIASSSSVSLLPTFFHHHEYLLTIQLVHVRVKRRTGFPCVFSIKLATQGGWYSPSCYFNVSSIFNVVGVRLFGSATVVKFMKVNKSSINPAIFVFM